MQSETDSKKASRTPPMTQTKQTGPPMIRKFRQLKELKKLAPYFDADYYLRANPDVASAAVNPVRHYLAHGWREGRNPSANFDTRFYLSQYPDVAASGMNPLVHYVEHGRFENRVSHPRSSSAAISPQTVPDALDRATQRALIEQHFDASYYLAAYPDVAASGLDPLDHYLDHGWNEGRNPHPDFCTGFYLDEFPDVRASGVHPYFHYLKWGRYEGRPSSSPILDRIALKPVDAPWQKPGILQHNYDLSVVIPTYNRAHMLPALLTSWRATHQRTKYDYEIIFSDDGSDDDTLKILEAATDLPITLVRNNHGGAAAARNAAVRAASGRLILFLGDDIFPDLWLINRHIEKHQQLPVTDAVLGLCDWHPELSVNHLMRHITEIGCEQFSYPHLPSHGYTDFRHFYTCNVSIDREFLLSEATIFDEAFYKVNFEDVELGYRLAKKGMRIFYYPEAYGDHYHPYNDVGRFCTRQAIAGEMAIVFNRLHAEASHLLPLRSIEERWSRYLGTEAGVYDFYGAVVALCQEAENRSHELDDVDRKNLSTAYAMLFRFAFEEGYCRHRIEQLTADAANRVMLDEFLNPDCRSALDQLARRLKHKPYAAMAKALEQTPAFVPSSASLGGQEHLETTASAIPNSKAVAAAASTATTLEDGLMTVVGEDWAHLNELMEHYDSHRHLLRFGIGSELAFAGMVYEPARGTEISAASMDQILLFLAKNPRIGRIVLSHGLFDLPEIGVRRAGKADVIARRTDAMRGKVIRVFGEAESSPIDLQSALPQGLLQRDDDGYFEIHASSTAQ